MSSNEPRKFRTQQERWGPSTGGQPTTSTESSSSTPTKSSFNWSALALIVGIVIGFIVVFGFVLPALVSH